MGCRSLSSFLYLTRKLQESAGVSTLRMTWEQRSRAQAIRRQDREDLSNRPFIGQVTAVDGFRERMTVNSPVGEAYVFAAQPFMSTNSWIRGIPESGAVVSLGYDGSSRRLAMFGYGAASSRTQSEGYAAGSFYYRDLLPGEIEISSNGLAQAYFGQRGLLSFRGGVVYGHYSQDRLESMQNAPTHVRQLHKHAPDTLGDEERYGLVKRPHPTNSSREKWFKTIDQSRFAHEYYRSLKPGSGSPTTLVEHIEGDVLDENGLPVILPMTGRNLRARSDYYTASEQTLTISIDEAGNFDVTLPADATEGGRLSIPTGGLRITVLRNLEMNATENISGEATRKVTFSGREGVELKTSATFLIPGGVAETDGVVTCKSMCPFLGTSHIDGSAKVLAEKGTPIPLP